MADPNDLTETIATEAASPIASSGDGQASTGRTLEELIKADQYLALKAALAGRGQVVYYRRFVCPGPAPITRGRPCPGRGFA